MYNSEEDFYADRLRLGQGSQQRGYLADAGLGIIGGAVEGVEGILELPTLIPGVDYDLGMRDRLGIAQTETWAGGLTEVATQLLVGFGAVGAAAKVAKATKLGAAAAQAAKAKIPAAVQQSTIAQNAAKGAAAEFVAFSGADSNFSNFLRDELGVDVTSFLALEEDDSEFTRRVKTTLEGAGLGVAVDGVLKAVRGMRKLQELNKKKRIDLENGGSGFDDAAEKEAQDIVENEIRPGLEDIETRPLTADEQAAEDVQKSLLDLVDDDTRLKERVKKRLYEPGRELGIPEDRLDAEALADWKALTTGERLKKAVLEFGTPGHPKDPRKRAANPRAVEKSDFDLFVATIAKNDKLAAAFRKSKSWGESLQEAYAVTRKMGFDGEAIARRMRRYTKSAEEAEVLYVAAVSDTHRLMRQWSELRKIGSTQDPKAISDWTKKTWGVEMSVAEFKTVVAQRYKMLQDAQYFLYRGKSATARHLQKMRMPATKIRAYMAARLAMQSADPGKVAAGQNMHDQLLEHYMREQGVRDKAKAFVSASDELKQLDLLEQGQDHLGQLLEAGDITQAGRAALVALEAPDKLYMRYWMFSLLSGVKTMSAAALGSMMTRFINPLERYVGMKALGGADKRITKSALEEMSSLWQLGAMRDAFMRSWRRNDSVFHGKTSLRNLGFDSAETAGMPKWKRRANETLDVFRRMLVSMDESTKVIQANKMLTTRFLRMGIEQNLNGKQLTDFVEERLSMALKDDILLTNESLMTRAVQDTFERYGDDIASMNPELFDLEIQRRAGQMSRDPMAQDVMQATPMVGAEVSKLTFTNQMAQDTAFTKFGESANIFVTKNPVAKLIVPFITAPVNMLDYARRRVALPVVNPEFWGQSVGMLNTLVKRTMGVEIPPKYRKGLEGFQEASRTFTEQLNSSDPDVAAGAMGRAIFGLSTTAMVAGAYSSGLITGSGPADQKLRRAMEAQGWQPYSFRVPNSVLKAVGLASSDVSDDSYGYLSLSRIEPFGSMIALVAEVCETLDHDMGEDIDAGLSEQLMTAGQSFMSGVVSVFAQNALSKSYLTGVDSFLEALGDESKVNSFVSRIAANIVPSAVAQFRDVLDDAPVTVPSDFGMFRQIIERTAARFPGAQGVYRDVANGFGLPGLAVKYNFLGEPMERVLSSTALGEGVARTFQFGLGMKFNSTTDETILNEMANLGHPIGLPRPKLGGIDLRDIVTSEGNSAFDRYMELTGEVRIKGRTMRDALTRTIRSAAYQKLPEAGIDELSEDSPRVRELDTIVREYRAEAQRRLEKELPELRGLLATRFAVRKALREGRRPEAIRSRFSILPGGR